VALHFCPFSIFSFVNPREYSGAMAKIEEKCRRSVKHENPRWLKSYIDFWDLITQELKRPYVFKPMPFEEILKALREGTIDITAVPIAVTASREDIFELSTPLGGGRLAVATRYKVWDHPWLSVIQIFFRGPPSGWCSCSWPRLSWSASSRG
jgi:Bacterial extracellular solute-binding proteins, family 3